LGLDDVLWGGATRSGVKLYGRQEWLRGLTLGFILGMVGEGLVVAVSIWLYFGLVTP
jgi:hypothetical protein